ncbi:hypothetical protein [Paramaledivibacter caminithermalis]|jgi:hypothetical protein|uniref:Uncharacterized protein n=1 Tax=Paramaledivibacter caminithermalis (strain DSM 15212 / CIP 107654 / DViRD3) TaxID=1121301 RepID=A0A1M6MNP4_PARC5|nr:hypothetical protein [Paramaledivibacter caminithermalis]SHJ85125.1 hypothetical protein SAMN02745912_01347 [Paramaledivibacter caminithermalis DSM 15212]
MRKPWEEDEDMVIVEGLQKKGLIEGAVVAEEIEKNNRLENMYLFKPTLYIKLRKNHNINY